MIPEIEKLEGFEEIQKFDNLLPLDYPEQARPHPLYYNYPLLEYVQQIANKIYPCFFYPFFDPATGQPLGIMKTLSYGADIFAKRYFDGEIDLSFKEKYETANAMLATIEGFGIDKDKFWYLILFLKDFVDGFAYGGELIDTPIMEIEKIIQFLRNQEECEYIQIQTNKNKHKTQNKKTIDALINCLTSGIEQIKQIKEYNQGGAAMKEDLTRRNIGLKQYFFTHYMLRFLQPYKPPCEAKETSNNKKSEEICYEKLILVSRIIYVINYTNKKDDLSFYNVTTEKKGKYIKSDKLKDCLRKYEKEKTTLRNMNLRYPGMTTLDISPLE